MSHYKSKCSRQEWEELHLLGLEVKEFGLFLGVGGEAELTTDHGVTTSDYEALEESFCGVDTELSTNVHHDGVENTDISFNREISFPIDFNIF